MTNDSDKTGMDADDPIYMELTKIFSPEAIERWIEPGNFGPIDNPDGHACRIGRCGDSMEIFLSFQDDRVNNATYMTDGCPSSNICGSFAADMALGKSPDEIVDISGDDVIARVGHLPEGDMHCATLAAGTLQAALDDYMKKQRDK